jgi:predicted DNA binding CopG/RHH family protein
MIRKRLDPIPPGEILREGFMRPLGITVCTWSPASGHAWPDGPERRPPGSWKTVSRTTGRHRGRRATVHRGTSFPCTGYPTAKEARHRVASGEVDEPCAEVSSFIPGHPTDSPFDPRPLGEATGAIPEQAAHSEELELQAAELPEGSLRRRRPVHRQAQDSVQRRFQESFDSSMQDEYDFHMRTTISLDERLAEQVKQRAASQGLSVSAFIAKTLNDALRRPARKPAPPFRLVTAGEGGVLPGVDLDRPNALVVAEDEEEFPPRRGR